MAQRTSVLAILLVLACCLLTAEGDPNQDRGACTGTCRRHLLADEGLLRYAWAGIDPSAVGCGNFQQLLHGSLVSVTFSASPDSPTLTGDAVRLLDENLTAYLHHPGASVSQIVPAAALLTPNVTSIDFCPVTGTGATPPEYLVNFNAIQFLEQNVVDDEGALQLACLLTKTVPVTLAQASHNLPNATNAEAYKWLAVVGNSLA